LNNRTEKSGGVITVVEKKFVPAAQHEGFLSDWH
jgi:hypothetical protein